MAMTTKMCNYNNRQLHGQRFVCHVEKSAQIPDKLCMAILNY